jgi:Kef-type K+ transport system membrane component KefB
MPRDSIEHDRIAAPRRLRRSLATAAMACGGIGGAAAQTRIEGRVEAGHAAVVSGFSFESLALQLIEIAGFCAIILYGLRHGGGWLLSRVGREEAAYFVILLCLLAVASVLAEVIDLPGIIGAFLAGLALNSTVKATPATTKLSFLATTLFIPAFFVVTGFLIDPLAFFGSLVDQFPLVLGIFLALLIGKAIAAETIGRAFGYPTAERLTMWSLTLPQVAATLAATLVAHTTFNVAGQPLLDGRMLNVVLVLVLLTSVLGPMLTARYAPRMMRAQPYPLVTGKAA